MAFVFVGIVIDEFCLHRSSLSIFGTLSWGDLYQHIPGIFSGSICLIFGRADSINQFFASKGLMDVPSSFERGY